MLGWNIMGLLICKMNKDSEICENWTAMNNNESTVIHVLQNKPLENLKKKPQKPSQMSNIYMLVIVIYYIGLITSWKCWW